MATRKRGGKLPLGLALQGGGAHGAFTWGVLDRLLDEPGIEVGRISGASAGALNGAALATGWAINGAAGAREHLARLWQKVAEAGSLMSFLMLPLRKPGMGVWDDAMPLLSPYQSNPMGMEPLRGVLRQVADLDQLRSAAAPQLFVNAVNVHTGHSRVFGPDELTIDVLLASACAPLMFQAVQIGGESYWDGTYAGNPMLWPLYEDQLDTDIFLIELTPLRRDETPTTAKNILNRINEIASIIGLVSEVRALDRLNRLVRGADIRLHVLGLDDEPMPGLSTEPSIKRTVARELFEQLRQAGHARCDQWLASHGQRLGREASVDIGARYLAPYTQSVVAGHG